MQTLSGYHVFLLVSSVFLLHFSLCRVIIFSRLFPHSLSKLFNQCRPLYYSTTGQLSIEDVPTMILCKPKLLPLKSVTLEKLEKMQVEAQEAVRQQELATKEQLQ